MLRFLRFKDLRDRFATVTDAVDQRMLLDKAVRDGNDDLLAALAVPVVPPVVDADLLAQAQAKRVEATNPEIVRLQALRNAYAAVLTAEEREAENVLEPYGQSLDSASAT